MQTPCSHTYTCSLSHIYTHTHIHSHIHTCTHTYLNTCTQTLSTCTYLQNVNTFTHIHSHTYTCSLICIHVHTCSYILIHAHTLTWTYACFSCSVSRNPTADVCWQSLLFSPDHLIISVSKFAPSVYSHWPWLVSLGINSHLKCICL